MTEWDNSTIISYASSLVTPHRLLYLCYSGSKLHGTNTPESDTDVKGVFLPTIDSCVLGNMPETLTYSSSKSKNNGEDIDITLWSFQKWVKLLGKGDSNALSMLFASLNMDMLLFIHPDMVPVCTHGYYLFDPKNIDKFIGFSRSQVLKYAKKGQRLKILEELIDLTNGYSDKDQPLGIETIDDIVGRMNSEYISKVKDEDGNTYIKVFNKSHNSNIKLSEFIQRIHQQHSVFGARAISSKDKDGIDWKALAHSMRTLIEAKEMLLNGYITYPLMSAPGLLDIKQGKIDLITFNLTYDDFLNEIRELEKVGTQAEPSRYDEKETTKMIFKLYDIPPMIEDESILS